MDESDLLTPATGGDTAPETDDVKHYREHLADMVAAIIKDDSISPDEKLAKIKAALKIDDAGSAEEPVVEDMEEEGDEESPVVEDDKEGKKDKKDDAEESLADGIASKVSEAVAKALARVDGLVAKKLEEAFGAVKKVTAKEPISVASGKKQFTKDSLLSELAGVI